MRVTSILSFCLPALVCMGCQSQTKMADLNCPDINGVDEVLSLDSPDIIVIGETHGMTAPPAFVSALTCHSLKAGLSTTLALELSDDNGRLAGYLESDGGGQAEDKLFEDPLWTTGFTDGRSSEAMLSLIDQARIWSSPDLDFQAFWFTGGHFDFESLETQNEIAAAWENHLANGILDASKGRDKTIVLVGNVHAMRGRVGFGELKYDSMMEHLPEGRALTFNTITTPGSSWNCTGQPTICGESPSGSALKSAHPFAQGGFKIIKSETMSDNLKAGFRFGIDEYDGVAFAGQAKASPPANAENRKPFGAN